MSTNQLVEENPNQINFYGESIEPVWYRSPSRIIIPVTRKGHKRLLSISWVANRKIVEFSHPYLYPVLDYRQLRSHQLCLLPFYPGQFLQTNQPRSLGKKISLIKKLALALEYGNKHCGAHGAIYPTNIYIEVTGRPYLLGYEHTEPANQNISFELMQFLSPEQIQDGHRSEVADIFSLASVFYYLLTKNSPYPSQNVSSLQQESAHFSPNLAPIPHFLAGFFRYALHPDPRKRLAGFSNMVDILAMLQQSQTIFTKSLRH